MLWGSSVLRRPQTIVLDVNVNLNMDVRLRLRSRIMFTIRHLGVNTPQTQQQTNSTKHKCSINNVKVKTHSSNSASYHQNYPPNGTFTFT